MTREVDNQRLNQEELNLRQDILSERLMGNVFVDQMLGSMYDTGLGGFPSTATLSDVARLNEICEELKEISKPQGKPRDNGSHAK